MIKVYALLVGRPWGEPEYSYLNAFYEELRSGTIGRDRGKKAARGVPMEIIDVLCALRGHKCEGGVMRLPAYPRAWHRDSGYACPAQAPNSGVSTVQEGTMGTFFVAAFPVNNGTNIASAAGLVIGFATGPARAVETTQRTVL